MEDSNSVDVSGEAIVDSVNGEEDSVMSVVSIGFVVSSVGSVLEGASDDVVVSVDVGEGSTDVKLTGSVLLRVASIVVSSTVDDSVGCSVDVNSVLLMVDGSVVVVDSSVEEGELVSVDSVDSVVASVGASVFGFGNFAGMYFIGAGNPCILMKLVSRPSLLVIR